MRKSIPVAAALCALAALPATAGAADSVVNYSVDASGSGTYNLNIDLSGPDHIETSTVEASFGWKASIPAVRFVNGRFVGIVAAPEQPTQMTGQLKRAIRHINKDNADRPVIVDCEGAEVEDEHMSSTAMTGVGGHPTGISFEPFDNVRFTDHKCTDGNKDIFGIFEDGGDPHGIWESPSEFDEFEQVFDLPAEAIGAGRITQFVKPQSDQLMPAQCPAYSQAPGERCSARLDWAGSIIFTKIPDDPEEPTSLVTPTAPDRFDAPPKPPAPVKPPVKPPFDDGDDLIAPLVLPPKTKVDASGRTVTFKAGCTAGCTGTATVTAGASGKGASASARRKALATLRFKVLAGKPRAIRLRLPAAARRHLLRHRRATLAVTLRPKGGAAQKKTLPIALPRR
ncbi:MAG: hypothetical protein AVDCRST_MAG30-3829 [uncultured Solirubrobacteraceae bacterium]|uniref:Uncharacterized protein n=1 Tax=uncultured Solirubrobacteraceae bacterium TaxID=1162706 RepID=A0A6J4TT69_9ACTN|nr:MAG: hypothetical protein AVDCRST_MAG30-3829 [uncultured Solirubrobacteraceae bacterium]